MNFSFDFHQFLLCFIDIFAWSIEVAADSVFDNDGIVGEIHLLTLLSPYNACVIFGSL